MSRPILTDDGLDALVYYEDHCGSTCGEGVLAWVHRDGLNAAWVIKKVRPFWGS